MSEKSKATGKLAKELEIARKKLKELNDWKERYESLIKASPHAVTLTDLEGKIIDLSRKTLTMYGYKSPIDLLGKSAFKLIAPKDRKAAALNMQKTLDKGFVKNAVYTMVKKDGSHFIGELDASLIKDSGRKPIAFIATTRDITLRRKSESELKRSEERFKSLFKLSPQAVVTLNMKAVITSCNPSAAKMMGYSQKDLVGKNALKLKSLIKKDIPRFNKILLSLVRGKIPEPFETAYFHKDGTMGWALVNVGLFDEGDGKKGIQVVVTDIAEQKKVEMALRESEEKYKALFDRSLYCVFVHDLEGNFIDANQAALDLLGYKKKDIPYLHFADLLDEEQMLLARKTMAEIIKSGHQKKSTQYRLKRKDGGHPWVETEASLVCKKGIPYGILGIARDITEDKKTEQALRESEEKYRKIFESLYDVYYRTDKEGIVTEISPSVYTQAGWDPEDVIGHPVTDFYRDPSTREIFAKTLKAKGVINDYELQLLAKDGRVFEVSVSSHIVFDDQRKALGVEGVLRDITTRKQMESALRESEEKFRTMIEHSLQGIFIIQDFRIVYANEAIAQITGYTLEELLSLPSAKVQGIVHPDDQGMVWGRMADRLAGKDVPSRYEFRVVRKDGETLWLEMVVGRIEFQGKPAVQGAVIDITDRQQADEQIKASLREKEVMLREIHHRVKNNMQIILSLLRIQSRTVKDTGTQEMFKQSQNRIRSMALIHEALYKSKDLAMIDIADYLRRMTTHLLSVYREALGEIEIKQEAEGVFLNINKAIPCGLIISELVSNCLKHAFPEKKQGQITIRISKNKKGIYSLIVKDNGIGLPEGLNYREAETLGLQLVTDLVLQINGSIQLKKIHETGTEFVIKF
jgi:PAS domain S-box-containing protein